MRQDAADPDAADERFMRQASNLDDEDYCIDAMEFGPDDEDEDDPDDDDDA